MARDFRIKFVESLNLFAPRIVEAIGKYGGQNFKIKDLFGHYALFETSTASDTNPLLKLKNSNADASGPILRFENSAGTDGSDDDYVGTISFYGEDDGTPSDIEYAKIEAQATDVTNSAKNGSVIFTAMVANASQEVARMNPESATAATFLGGFGFKRPVVVLSSGSTYVLTGDQSGVLIVLNNAFSGGMTITLPADTAANVGFFCSIVIAVTQTGTLKIASAADGDIMYGAVTLNNTSHQKSRVFAGGGSNDNLTFDADTDGRLAGSVYHITIGASNVLFVEGHGVQTGNPTTPFTTS